MVQGIATQTMGGVLPEAGALGLAEQGVKLTPGSGQVIRLSARGLSLPDQGSRLSDIFGAKAAHAAQTRQQGGLIKSLLKRIKSLGKCLLPCLSKKNHHKRSLQEQVLILQKDKLQLTLDTQRLKYHVDFLKEELARMTVERNDVEHLILEELPAFNSDKDAKSAEVMMRSGITDRCEQHHQNLNDEFFQLLQDRVSFA